MTGNDTLSAGNGDDDRKRRWSVETYVVLGIIIIWDYSASVVSPSKSALAAEATERGDDEGDES